MKLHVCCLLFALCLSAFTNFAQTPSNITTAASAPLSAAIKEEVLHSFGNGKDGQNPYAALIFDASGNLFGTTHYGGSGTCKINGGVGCGTVFELTPKAGGGWTEKILHSFEDNGKDGTNPYASSLIFDASGNLFGATVFGGAGTACGGYGCGTVFELTPKAGGGWTEKILYSFKDNGKDGTNPYGSLIFDASGNLYGTTGYGGVHGLNWGTVFELTPKAGGGWTEKVLHSFGMGNDTVYPNPGLILDASGNLYGTTWEGGTNGYGTVFELTPKAGGGWTEKILHSFGKVEDGQNPYDNSLIFDASGNLYGTTFGGGAESTGCNDYGCGTVFELTPKAGGGWKEKILHSFNDYSRDGYNPYAGLIFDASGNLYGTTANGGGCNDPYSCGTVFELTPKAGGGWTEKTLHSFNDKPKDGYHPNASLIFDASDNLYGTTAEGGTYGYGTVFEVKP
jgi:uncharacterized repeat protein (TIGR03803 family)